MRARRTAGASATGFLLLSLGCDEANDKKPLSAPVERSQVVAAKATTASAPAAAAPAAAAKGSPSAPRVVCAGQMSQPGRPAPKTAVSQEVAQGEPALPDSLPLGGAYTWVNFWAAWCAPCKEEIPRLLQFEAELAKVSPGFRVTFVSLDDDARQLTGFLAGQPTSAGLRRTYWLKEGKQREDWLKGAGVESDPELPFHLLFDAKGKIRCLVKGAVEDADLSAIRALVAR